MTNAHTNGHAQAQQAQVKLFLFDDWIRSKELAEQLNARFGTDNNIMAQFLFFKGGKIHLRLKVCKSKTIKQPGDQLVDLEVPNNVVIAAVMLNKMLKLV